MGVAHSTIRDSKLGHLVINAIENGTFNVENSEIRGRSVINLRSDYGSNWERELIMRDCIFIRSSGNPLSAVLLSGFRSGQHDSGCICYMPLRVTIENSHNDDSNHPDNYLEQANFGKLNSENIDNSYLSSSSRIASVRLP